MNDSDILNNVEIFSNHYIERFKQLLDNEQQNNKRNNINRKKPPD